MGSTVRATSNFRHFVNSLRKRRYQYAAGYAAAIGTTVSTATTAADVWRHTKDVAALQEMLAFFFHEVYDGSPPFALADAYRIAHVVRGGTAAERVDRIHELVPDPFALIDSDGDGETVQPARRDEARELRDPRVIPLMFRFNDLIEGRGFVAKIKTDGRAVAEQEDDRWWISGVTPGGVCASGETPDEALKSFRLTYHKVLLDCALRCETFDSFRAGVEMIFNSTTEEILGEWRNAVAELRDGASAGPFDSLERVPSESRAYAVRVEERDQGGRVVTAGSVIPTWAVAS